MSNAPGRGSADDGHQAHVVPERPEHFDAIRAVVRAAFAHHLEVADLVERIRASPEYVADLALVALRDDAPVGFVMVSGTDLVEVDGTRHHALTLSPLAVHPDHERQGIGGLLVRTALQRSALTDEPLVTLEGSPRYYPRFGFEPAGGYGVSITLPDWAPAEAAMVHPLPAYRPEVRGHVDYPPAFSELG